MKSWRRMIRDEVNLQHIMENAASATLDAAMEKEEEAIEANEGQFPPPSIPQEPTLMTTRQPPPRHLSASGTSNYPHRRHAITSTAAWPFSGFVSIPRDMPSGRYISLWPCFCFQTWKNFDFKWKLILGLKRPRLFLPARL